jgi:glutathione S-transferase
MKVYGFPLSTCTRKVLMTLHEKNHPYEFISVDIGKGQQKQPEYLARQPFGVVPVLDHDGFSLYESRAIIRYLDAALPGEKLTPTDVKNFGEMEQWINVEQAYLSGPAIQLIKQLYFAKMQRLAPNTAIIEEAIPKVEHVLDVAEQRLAKTPYFAGSTFSLADITWMPYIEYLFPSGLGDLIQNRSGLKAWWEKVSQRPSWVKIVGKFE